MIKRRKLASTAIVLIATLVIIYIAIDRSFISVERMIEAGNDFQYDIITISITMAGFLFTGISILISATGNERVKRLWDHHYLDDLSINSTIGILASVISVISAFVLLWCSLTDGALKWLATIEICSIAVTVVFFAWCVLRLAMVVSKLKD